MRDKALSHEANFRQQRLLTATETVFLTLFWCYKNTIDGNKLKCQDQDQYRLSNSETSNAHTHADKMHCMTA